MRAQVSDDFDLVISWNDSGLSQITWSACSDGEFEVKAEINILGGLHFQGATRLEFSTVCYAYSLRALALELGELISGKRDSARYCGTEDMIIQVHRKTGEADAKDQSIMVCDLQFQIHRFLDLIHCGGSIEATLGRLEEPKEVIRAINEVMTVLKMKDRPYS